MISLAFLVWRLTDARVSARCGIPLCTGMVTEIEFNAVPAQALQQDHVVSQSQVSSREVAEQLVLEKSNLV
jgi:hypothetical protein